MTFKTPIELALAAGPVEAVGFALDRIADDRHRELNAWVRIYESEATTAASRLAAGLLLHPLHGLPVGVKDVIGIAGQALTASSTRLPAAVVARHARAWSLLDAAGAVAVGHCHTHEFAAGATTDQCGNPWDPALSPGGSSGGSAAAVASGAVPVALGTDTAGSLRIPAALCGLSTVKATEGLVSNAGTVPLGATFDTIGPMAVHVSDVRRVFEHLVEPERRAGLKAMAERRGQLSTGLQGVKFGVLEARAEVAVAEVRGGVQRVREVLAEAGGVGRVVDLPDGLGTTAQADAYMGLLLTDIWRFHRTLRDTSGRYGADVAGLVRTASARSMEEGAYYAAQACRGQLSLAWDRFLDEQGLDFVLEPTCPVTAPTRVWPGCVNPAGLELARLTTLWNYTGSPVVALPAGLSAGTALPIGVSLIGRRHDDLRLLHFAELLQDRLPPPIWRAL